MSPVMARSPRTGPPENADTSAATIVTGRRPFRRLRARPHVQMHVGVPMESRVEALSSGVGPRPRQRDSHRLLHGLPRRPVRVSALEPGIRVASTETTSQPPAAVRHSPTATPGRPARRVTSPSGCAGAPSISTTVSGVTSTGASFPFLFIVLSVFFFVLFVLIFPFVLFVPVLIGPVPLGTAAHHLGAQRAERPGQVPHSRLPGVVGLLGRRRSRMQADRRQAQARRRGVDAGRRQRHHRPAPQQAQRPLRGFLGATSRNRRMRVISQI